MGSLEYSDSVSLHFLRKKLNQGPCYCVYANQTVYNISQFYYYKARGGDGHRERSEKLGTGFKKANCCLLYTPIKTFSPYKVTNRFPKEIDSWHIKL